MNNQRPKTIILDLDGTLIYHKNAGASEQMTSNPGLLEGTLGKLNEWDKRGYNIIILTGRKEGMRGITEKYLENKGIFYDQLIMGVGGGARFLINDKKQDSDSNTAYAINLERNKGIKNVEI